MMQSSKPSLTSFQKLFLSVYTAVGLLTYPVVWILTPFFPILRRQLASRGLSTAVLQELKQRRQAYQHSAVFFCSSAGEYEQALPMIHRLSSEHKTFCVLFLNSVSGYQYARVRDEKTPFFLAPLDFYWSWHEVFKILQPQITVVVRYEFWPAFLANAWRYSRLYLVDAGSLEQDQRQNQPLSGLQFVFKKFVLSFFDKVFLVSENDRGQYASLGVGAKIEIAGDTKYDRVLERLDSQTGQVKRIQEIFHSVFGSKKFFIVGSGWRPEIELGLTVFVQLPQEVRAGWRLILAPHDIGKDMVNWIQGAASERGLKLLLFSQLLDERGNLNEAAVGSERELLLVDTMGKLAEIYGSGSLALVGGAFDRKIHNVLEPAVHGLLIAFGPNYSAQKEAIMLKQEKLATVVSNSDELKRWWLSHRDPQPSDKAAVKAKVLELTGASQRIVTSMKKEFK